MVKISFDEIVDFLEQQVQFDVATPEMFNPECCWEAYYDGLTDDGTRARLAYKIEETLYMAEAPFSIISFDRTTCIYVENRPRLAERLLVGVVYALTYLDTRFPKLGRFLEPMMDFSENLAYEKKREREYNPNYHAEIDESPSIILSEPVDAYEISPEDIRNVKLRERLKVG